MTGLAASKGLEQTASGPVEAKPHSNLVALDDYKTFPPRASGPLPGEFGTRSQLLGASFIEANFSASGSPFESTGSAPLATPVKLDAGGVEQAPERKTVDDAASAFKDDPSLSPAQRALKANSSVALSGVMTDEHRQAFESAIKQADAESIDPQTGKVKPDASPRIPELEGELAAADRLVKSLGEGLLAKIDKLPPETQKQVNVLLVLRAAGLGDVDAQLNNLVPDKNEAGDSFTQQMDKLSRLADSQDEQKLNLTLEQRESSFTRVSYALALNKVGDSAKAKELLTKAIDLDPEASKDAIAQRLMQELGVKPSQPL